MSWDIRKITRLLWADFLAEIAGWTGESRKVITDCSEKLSAAIIAKRVQDQFKVHRVSLKMVGPIGFESTNNRLWWWERVRLVSRKRKNRNVFSGCWLPIWSSPNLSRTLDQYKFSRSKIHNKVFQPNAERWTEAELTLSLSRLPIRGQLTNNS